jgi:hypothetical protein
VKSPDAPCCASLCSPTTFQKVHRVTQFFTFWPFYFAGKFNPNPQNVQLLKTWHTVLAHTAHCFAENGALFPVKRPFAARRTNFGSFENQMVIFSTRRQKEHRTTSRTKSNRCSPPFAAG